MAEITLSDDQSAVLRDAVYEIDKLARILPSLVPIDEDQAHYAVKGIGGRLLRLTSALMEGLDNCADHARVRNIIHFAEDGQG